MLLKIYLIVSISTLILLLVTNLSMINRAKKILRSRNEDTKDVMGVVAAIIRQIVISFIPIVNIMILFALTFCSDDVEKRANKIIEDAVNKEE